MTESSGNRVSDAANSSNAIMLSQTEMEVSLASQSHLLDNSTDTSIAISLNPSQKLLATTPTIRERQEDHTCNMSVTYTPSSSFNSESEASMRSPSVVDGNHEVTHSSSNDTFSATNTSDDMPKKNIRDVSNHDKFIPDYHGVEVTMKCIVDAKKSQRVSGGYHQWIDGLTQTA